MVLPPPVFHPETLIKPQLSFGLTGENMVIDVTVLFLREPFQQSCLLNMCAWINQHLQLDNRPGSFELVKER